LRYGKTADQTTLAADIALDRTTTTGALKRLAARNFVERAVMTRTAARGSVN
jgi:DNA-binding MarR family transcriptional regulator